MSDTVYNTETISASALASLLKEIPIMKAKKYLKLLVPNDLGQYREFLQNKLKVNDEIIAKYQAEPSPDVHIPVEVNLTSIKDETLFIFDMIHTIDKMFDKIRREEEKEANQGMDSRGRQKKSKLKLLLDGE